MPELQLDADDARALPAHRQRRDAAARADHRRPARPGAARRRRRHAASARTCRSHGCSIACRRATSASCDRTARHAGRRHRARAREVGTAIPIGSSRRCRTWPPTRCATRRTAAEIALAAERSATTRARCACATAGPGIPPEHLPLIFDRFYKADARARRRRGGSGLGLSIVKAIVERHGGTISAHNEGGAVFDILLPAAVKARPTRRTAACHRRTTSAARRDLIRSYFARVGNGTAIASRLRAAPG